MSDLKDAALGRCAALSDPERAKACEQGVWVCDFLDGAGDDTAIEIPGDAPLKPRDVEDCYTLVNNAVTLFGPGIRVVSAGRKPPKVLARDDALKRCEALKDSKKAGACEQGVRVCNFLDGAGDNAAIEIPNDSPLEPQNVNDCYTLVNSAVALFGSGVRVVAAEKKMSAVAAARRVLPPHDRAQLSAAFFLADGTAYIEFSISTDHPSYIIFEDSNRNGQLDVGKDHRIDAYKTKDYTFYSSMDRPIMAGIRCDGFEVAQAGQAESSRLCRRPVESSDLAIYREHFDWAIRANKEMKSVVENVRGWRQSTDQKFSCRKKQPGGGYAQEEIRGFKFRYEFGETIRGCNLNVVSTTFPSPGERISEITMTNKRYVASASNRFSEEVLDKNGVNDPRYWDIGMQIDGADFWRFDVTKDMR